MSSAFWGVSILGGIFFLLSKRRFDFLSVGYCSAIVYFLPGFFGVTLYPLNDQALVPVPLAEETLAIMTAVLSAILLGGVAMDLLYRRDAMPPVRLVTFPHLSEVAAAIGVAGFVLTVLTSGPDLLSNQKREMMASLSQFYTAWEYGASIGLVSAFIQKRAWLVALSTLLLVGTLVIGFRYPIALAFTACITHRVHSRGEIRFLVSYWKLIPVLVVGGTFFCVYKQVLWNLKSGHLDRVSAALTNPDTYLESLVRSEPFITQTILNEVVERGFSIDMGYLAGNAYQFLPGSQAFGAETITFNEQFQPALFPQITYGLAANIWAEGCAVAGWYGVCLIAAALASILVSASFWLRSRDVTIGTLVSLSTIIFAFYAHRNEIASLITLEKRLLLFLAVCCAIDFLFLRRPAVLKEATV